jgi:transposase
LKEYTRPYAYAASNERVFDEKSGKNRKRHNVIGALCNGKHIGIKIYEQNTNSLFVEEWFEGLLKILPRACTVILDNASFHRKTILEEIIRKSRRKIELLFLPPYSPDLNPIEKSWANLKRFLCDYEDVYLRYSIYCYFLKLV